MKNHERVYSKKNLDFQEKPSSELCHFCFHKCRCLLEHVMKMDAWCTVFQPHSDKYFSVNQARARGSYEQFGNRLLRTYRDLYEKTDIVIALAMNHEKPIFEYFTECPKCSYWNRTGQFVILLTCNSCLDETDLSEIPANRRTETKHPLVDHMMRVKKLILMMIEMLTQIAENKLDIQV